MQTEKTIAQTVHSVHDLEPQLANFRGYWLGWGRQNHTEDGLTTYRSEISHPLFNGVARWRGDGSASSSSGALDEAVATAKERLDGVPWWWWVGPDSDPGLAEALLARGATLVSTTPIMAAETERVGRFDGPPGLVVEETADPEALREWVAAMIPGSGIDPALVDAAIGRSENRSDGSEGLSLFVGRLEGRVVGTASLYDRDGVAGLYAVSTAEGYRRRGIGAAISVAAVQAGRERGLRVATLQSSALGRSLYERLGFETVSAYRIFVFGAGGA